jgi:hypothetical protein
MPTQNRGPRHKTAYDKRNPPSTRRTSDVFGTHAAEPQTPLPVGGINSTTIVSSRRASDGQTKQCRPSFCQLAYDQIPVFLRYARHSNLGESEAGNAGR